MREVALTAAAAALLGLTLSASVGRPPRPPSLAGQIRASARQAAQAPKPVASPQTFDTEAQNALVKQYCSTCHNATLKSGGVSLAGFDAAQAPQHAAVAEKMIRKLRAGMMPPAGARRPDAARLSALTEALETRIDRAAALGTNPGGRPFQRLNRAEYVRAVKDLLAVDVDVNAYLPPDTISNGFDNVADAQELSATLLEGYLRAAGRIASLAVGDRDAASSEANFKVPKTASQLTRAEGAPYGTRGGLSVVHTFPADGEYVFRMDLHSNACGVLYGGTAEGEQLEVSINGERLALLSIDPRMMEATTGVTLKTPPIYIKAGPQRITAAFVKHFEGPVIDLIAPIDHTLADTQIGVAYGVTTLPHLKDLSIVGPLRVTGVSDTASRQKIFSCRPTAAGEEGACAASIVSRLATEAFRGSVTDRDVSGLMKFYEDGRRERDFEAGIAVAIEAILASPQFLFRLEPMPAGVKAGGLYRVGDRQLASRLSFFLWGTAPDAELLKIAGEGRLGVPATLEKQVARMLADPRAEALATRFASQWLRLNDVELMLPDAILFPYYDQTLGAAFERETELFFDSLVREDRSVLDLLHADYTFVNERIAKHYGIPNVMGSTFQRVQVPEYRRGILGHGSILTLTSVADRTSPVMRGKWILEVLLGSPPPPPLPNVPALEDTKAAEAGRLLTVRQRMEEHRKDPACTSCHRVIDPLGVALENFDVTGKWRIKDNGAPIDSIGDLYDGTRMEGPAGLRSALRKHQDVFLLSFTENLMTYALGRRVESGDMPAIRQIIREAAAREYRMSSFVQGIVRSAAFQMAKAAPAETAGGK